MSNRNFALVVIAVLIVAGLIVFGASQNWLGNDRIVKNNEVESIFPAEETPANTGAPQKPTVPSISESLGIDDSEVTTVGGIARPKRDVRKAPKVVNNELPINPLPSPGRLPTLKGDENPQVERHFKELKQEDAPKAARSSMFLPEPFDKASYFANPEEYLQKIRPGRVFQAAAPGPDVKPLVATSKKLQTLLQGESSLINVRTSEPEYPVTFYAPDGGEFSNRLKSITVASDKDGIARAQYKATSGTKGLMNVIAAGPLNSGQAKFAIRVLLPSE